MNRDDTSFKPLVWPASMKRPTKLQKFLAGAPIMGPERVAYRDLRGQVAARPNDCLESWEEGTRDVRDVILDVLEKNMGWRSRNFIPQDPCDILFCGPERDPCAVAEALMCLENRLGVTLDPEAFRTMTLGELVESVRTADA